MSNKTELLVRLREELGDTGGAHTWTDSLLGHLLDEAVDWYSRLFPVHTDAFRDVAAGQRTFDIPSGAIAVAQVECPPGIILGREAGGSTGYPGSSATRQTWSTWAGNVFLSNGAHGSEIGTGNLIMRLLMPWPPLDPVEDWEGPASDERLLVMWAAAEAWAWLDGQDRKRGRVSDAGFMSTRYAEEVEREVSARSRSASSRRLEVD
jgi:hypothetical protein